MSKSIFRTFAKQNDLDDIVIDNQNAHKKVRYIKNICSIPIMNLYNL